MTQSFDAVLRSEHSAIGERRKRVGKRPPAVSPVVRVTSALGSEQSEDANPKIRMYDTVGLSLSGGGIRSAAISLGVLQALHARRALNAIDYISTVSGGGYAGTALVAYMSNNYGNFPFATGQGSDNADIKDSDALLHIRNYSSYLFPRDRTSTRNMADVAIIVARGIATNIILLGLLVGVAAMLTALVLRSCIANGCRLEGGAFFRYLLELLDLPAASHLVSGFRVPIIAYGLLAIGLLSWTLAKSVGIGPAQDTSSGFLTWLRRSGWVCAAILLLDCLPWLVQMAREALSSQANINGEVTLGLSSMLASLTALVGVAATLFSSRLTEILKAAAQSRKYSDYVKRLGSYMLLVVAAALIPGAIVGAYVLASAYFVDWDGALLFGWIAGLSVTFGLLSAVIGPNSYALHTFYKERLGAAFLNFGEDKNFLVPPLSSIDASLAPYPIVNSALNIKGSLRANKLGRNADFFVFSPKFVGSVLTGYVATEEVEEDNPDLDLGTVMAISGAAISSNMGYHSVAVLAPTLALLNFRLGYWMRNPKMISNNKCKTKVNACDESALRSKMMHRANELVEKTSRSQLSMSSYLIKEMLGQLDEESHQIYLTDGGHIENLGIYELLRRGCRLIIAVDAEADANYGFSALMRLQRYARIDLGVRIELPWPPIQRIGSKINHELLDLAYGVQTERPHVSEKGPHAAIGAIRYPDGNVGVLLYVKASMTGDERDYVIDYKRRHSQFPHETTGDQFFSEEQFESYRWLGFHMMDRALSSEDTIACDPTSSSDRTSKQDFASELRDALWSMQS